MHALFSRFPLRFDRHAAARALVLLATAATTPAAVITGDNFDNNSLSPLLWQTNGSETLIETNQRLEFSPSGVDGDQWYLTSRLTLPTDQTWRVEIDFFHVAPITGSSFLGFALFSSRDGSDSLHYLVSVPGMLTANVRELTSLFASNGSYVHTSGAALGTTTRLVLENSGYMLYLSRGSFSPVVGWSYTNFLSYDLHGVGGGSASADWDTQSGDTFTLRLTASASQAVASGQMTFDNFYASTPTGPAPIPEPATAAALAGALTLALVANRRRR
jgi:hypothetical protein